MRHFLMLGLFISPPVFAKSWLAQKCDTLLGRGGAESVSLESPVVGEIVRRLQHEVFRGNQLSRHRMAVTVEPVSGVGAGQATPVVRSVLDSDFQWVRQPEIKLFVDPNQLDQPWDDEGDDLSRGRSLMALIENVSISAPGGPRRVIELLQEEARFVRERNPDLKFELRVANARDVQGLEGVGNDRFLVWAEGDMRNYQALRLMIVTLQYAFDVLARDPAYVRARAH